METEIIVPRVRDAARLCEISGIPKFVGFLTPVEAAVAVSAAAKSGYKYEIFGGYEGAERVFFGVFPQWCAEKQQFYPIKAVTFAYRRQDKLSHRDFLGSLMSLGIKRESVGDILTEEGRAVAFLSAEILKCVLTGIEKVGSVGVTVTEGYTMPLPGGSSAKEITETVASLRLDAVVAALIGTSRAKAAELIEQKLVSVNSVVSEKGVKMVRSGDIITVRGKGRFIIDSAEDKTRKDRTIIKVKKFI